MGHSIHLPIWVKPAVFTLCLLPLMHLVYLGRIDQLGANPVEAVIHSTGIWSLVFLMVTLTITPARRLLKQPWLLQLRRMLGQYAFFYGSLHFLVYMWLDQSFDWHGLVHNIIRHPFITFGFISWLAMVPLSLTSTNSMVRWLGTRRWQRLHQLVYVSALTGVVHYLLEVKIDIREPMIYVVILLVLLGYRLMHWWLDGPRISRKS